MTMPPINSAPEPARVRAAQARLLDGPTAVRMSRVRSVFCEPTRTQIVRALGAGPLSVTELTTVVKRHRTVISQHLRILREAGILRRTRRGRVAWYALTTVPLTQTTVKAIAVVVDA